MKNNTFLFYLALGVVLMSSTLIWGFPDRPISKADSTVAKDFFTGTWISRERMAFTGAGETEAEYLYQFDLKQQGNQISGTHCFSLNNATRIDCNSEFGSKKETVKGQVNGNTALVNLVSSFSEEPIKVVLTAADGKLKFMATKTDDIVPMEVILQKTISREELVGIWQNSGGMAAGWAEHINFYPDGKYHYYTNSMDCARRKLQEDGEWQIMGDKLILTKLSEVNLVGGKMVKATASCLPGKELQGAKETTTLLKSPDVEELFIKRSDRTENDNYDSILMTSLGGYSVQYWKFSDDPTYGNEFPE